MKRYLFAASLFLFAGSTAAYAQDTAENEGKNNWGGKLIKSLFGIGLDIQTKYMWREWR